MADPHTHTAPVIGTPAAPGAKPGILGEVDSPPQLFLVLGGVLLLFFATFGMSVSGALGKYTLFAQLAIASVQAGLVAYYFMHLRHGDRVVILTALASVFWVGILFVLFMADYMTRHKVVGWW